MDSAELAAASSGYRSWRLAAAPFGLQSMLPRRMATEGCRPGCAGSCGAFLLGVTRCLTLPDETPEQILCKDVSIPWLFGFAGKAVSCAAPTEPQFDDTSATAAKRVVPHVLLPINLDADLVLLPVRLPHASSDQRCAAELPVRRPR